jgi:hypothetical protein
VVLAVAGGAVQKIKLRLHLVTQERRKWSPKTPKFKLKKLSIFLMDNGI